MPEKDSRNVDQLDFSRLQIKAREHSKAAEASRGRTPWLVFKKGRRGLISLPHNLIRIDFETTNQKSRHWVALVLWDELRLWSSLPLHGKTIWQRWGRPVNCDNAHVGPAVAAEIQFSSILSKKPILGNSHKSVPIQSRNSLIYCLKLEAPAGEAMNSYEVPALCQKHECW